MHEIGCNKQHQNIRSTLVIDLEHVKILQQSAIVTFFMLCKYS